MLTRHLKRGLAALLGFWFLLVVIEPEAVHSCPVHVSAVSAATSSHSHLMHGATHGDSGKSSHAICSCPGDCAASGFGAIPSSHASLPHVIAATVENDRPTLRVNAPERVGLLLPFAVGPPAFSIG